MSTSHTFNILIWIVFKFLEVIPVLLDFGPAGAAHSSSSPCIPSIEVDYVASHATTVTFLFIHLQILLQSWQVCYTK